MKESVINQSDEAEGAQQEEQSDLNFVRSPEIDVVAGRYKILVNRPIAEYETAFCDSYEVENVRNPNDTEKYYALVFKPNLPVPFKKISLFRKHIFENLQIPLETEFVRISINSQLTVVSVFTRMKIPSLHTLIVERIPIVPNAIIQYVLLPIARLMGKFEALNISHGKLTIKNIFYHPISNQLIVGECISEFPGYSYPPYYKCLDTVETISQTIGEGKISHDFFAIGVSIGLLVSGRPTLESSGTVDLTSLRYEISSYDALFGKIISLPIIKDLLRGLLNDRSSEIWHTKQVLEWVSGKRYATNSYDNKESIRTLLFNDKKFSNLRSFSHYLFNNWDIAKKAFQDENVIKWIEKGLSMPEVSESISYILKFGYRPQISAYPERDEVTVKILATLNPMAPIRLRDMAISLDSIPNMITFGFAQGKSDFLDAAGRVICINLWSTILLAQLQTMDNLFVYRYLAQLETARTFLERKQIGFSMERCLYELNSTLPCQSPLLIQDFVLTVQELLQSLEKKATEDERIDLFDKHIIAFLTAKIGLTKEVKFPTVENFPKVATNMIVKAISIYAAAQNLPPYKSYYKLSSIFAQRLMETVEIAVSNKIIKDNVKNKLIEASEKGNISSLLKIIVDPIYLRKDHVELQRAINLAKLLKTQLKPLQNQNRIYQIGYRYGFKLCVSFSYLLFSFMIIYTIYQSV